MKIYLLVALSLALPVALGTNKPIESLNSVFLSQLRLNVRLLDDPVKQCVKYLEGIRYKIEGYETKESTSNSNEMNIGLLNQVADMLKARTPSLDSNGLISYTSNCAEVLSKYQGDNHVNQSFPELAASSSVRSDNELNRKLELENEKLRSEAVERLDKIKHLETELKLSELNIASYKEVTEKEQKALKFELNDLKNQLESEKTRYVGELEELKRNLQVELEKAQLEVGECRNDLSKALSDCQCSNDKFGVDLNQQKAANAECLANLGYEKKRREDAEKANANCSDLQKNQSGASEKARQEAEQCKAEINQLRKEFKDSRDKCELDLEQQKAENSKCSVNLSYEKNSRQEVEEANANLHQKVRELEIEIRNGCQQVYYMNSGYYVPKEDLDECREQLDGRGQNRQRSDQSRELEELKAHLESCHQAKEEADRNRHQSDWGCSGKVDIYKELTKDVEDYIEEGNYEISCNQWFVKRQSTTQYSYESPFGYYSL